MDEAKLSQLQKMFKRPESIDKVATFVQRAVNLSIMTHPVTRANLFTPSLTIAETKRRAKFLLDWTSERFQDQGWGVERVCDKMFDALLAELNKTKPVEETDDDPNLWVGE